MGVLMDYKDIMSLGFSKKTAYQMLERIAETDEYKNSNLFQILKTKKVTKKMFVKTFPELKKEVEAL